MAARDVIVATVRDFLGDIEKLKLEKDGVEPVNAAKATYLQSEIFRKFGIIDSLLDSCPEAKATMKEEVFAKKKDAKAEAEDLEKIPVPKALEAKVVREWNEGRTDKGSEKEEPFPYLELPPEVRRVILGYLTSPSDKLNLVKALPEDGDMMEWNPETLRLQMVLTILLKRNKMTSADLIKLFQSGPPGGVIQTAVSNCYEVLLRDNIADVTYYISSDYSKRLEEYPTDLNPIPGRIIVEFHGLKDTEGTRLQKFQSLSQMGRNIWDCRIRIYHYPTVQTAELIRDILTLTSNLRHLELQLYPNSSKDLENSGTLADVELPDLPRLQLLDFDGSQCESIATKLAKRYQDRLLSIKTVSFDFLPETADGSYPRLECIDAQVAYHYSDEVPVTVSRLNAFSESPLKYICANISVDNNENADDFRNLMCCLNQFGGTLEELHIKLGWEDVPQGATPDFSWLGKINFPKVKVLTIRGFPGTWNILLHFPALETLKLKRCNRGRVFASEPYLHFQSSRILQLSWNPNEMYRSNIWKLMPFLKTIAFGKTDSQKYKISRTGQCSDADDEFFSDSDEIY